MNTTAYYEQGSEKNVTCVFSCPGRLEEKNNRPVSGVTGSNLNKLFLILNDKLKVNVFERGKVTITNATCKIEYKSKTGKSEGTKKEVLEDSNLERLFNDLCNTEKYILVFGENAKLALKEIEKRYKFFYNPKIIYVRHLGLQSLNQIKNDINHKPLQRGESNNTIKRLEVVVEDMLKQMKNQ